MSTDRRKFLKYSLMGAVGSATAITMGQLTGCTAKPLAKPDDKLILPLNIAFQEGTTPYESLNEKLDYMESLGIVGLEPWGRNLDKRVNEFETALKGRSVKMSAICAGFDGFLLATNQKDLDKFFETYKPILEAAGRLGSCGVIMVPGFNSQQPCRPHTQDTRKWLVEQLQQLGAYAEQCKTTVILEPLMHDEAFFLRQVGDAARICRDVNSKGVTCMGDFWHMTWEENNDYGAFHTAGEYLSHVHIASRARRSMPGEDGEADNYINGFKALKEMGYTGHVSFECGSQGDKATTIPAAVKLMREQWEKA